MNPKFRFDFVNSRIVFLSDEGKTVCSFNEVLCQINELAEQIHILDDIFDNAKQRIVKQSNEKQFLATIHAYEREGFHGAFYSFLYESIHQYIIVENEKCVDAVTLLYGPQDYISDHNAPKFEELKFFLKTFMKMDVGFFPNQLPSTYTIQADVLSGDAHYSSDLSCNVFLIMFRDLLISTGTAVCVCTVCGDVFCGKPGDNCCGKSDCERYLNNADPKQKKTDLSKISKNFSLNIRQHRYRIKNKCTSPEAMQEFNAFTEPIQNHIIERVKELRTNDAPVKEIRELKMEVDQKYTEINEKAKEIMAKYS